MMCVDIWNKSMWSEEGKKNNLNLNGLIWIEMNWNGLKWIEIDWNRLKWIEIK